jgi:hypothetical protein
LLFNKDFSEEDLTGHIMSKNFDDWTSLILPMRYEWRRHSYSVLGDMEWHDPRGLDDDGDPLVTVNEDGERIPVSPEAQIVLEDREGQLLWPDRFGEREVAHLESQLGPYVAAGQLQQRPEPKGGGIIKREWWQSSEEKYPPIWI